MKVTATADQITLHDPIPAPLKVVEAEQIVRDVATALGVEALPVVKLSGYWLVAAPSSVPQTRSFPRLLVGIFGREIVSTTVGRS